MAELRNQIIQTLIATSGQSEGVTADALLSLMGQGDAVHIGNIDHQRNDLIHFNDGLVRQDLLGIPNGTPIYAGHPAPAVDDGVVLDGVRLEWMAENSIAIRKSGGLAPDPHYFLIYRNGETSSADTDFRKAIDAAMKEQQDANPDN